MLAGPIVSTVTPILPPAMVTGSWLFVMPWVIAKGSVYDPDWRRQFRHIRRLYGRNAEVLHG